MDSITQISLGAAIGESVLGKKIGIKAAAWGALLGTLPDFDVFASPFLDNVADVYFHRSFSHSILFCVLAAPIFGWFIDRIHKKLEIGWEKWTQLAFLVFITHIGIDLLTDYGTQILYPVSNKPFTTDSIFIVDPIYTVTLLIGLITALFLKRSSQGRVIANRTGLLISTLYLIWGLGIKAHVHSIFDASYDNQYGYYDKMKTLPTGPSTLLWTGYVMREDTIYQANYSIFDESTDLEFRAIPKRTELIEPYLNDRALEALLWFSMGYYTVQREGDRFAFCDLRFGRSDFWLTQNENTEYVWKNYLLIDENGKASNFDFATPFFDTRSSIFSRFISRIKGH